MDALEGGMGLHQRACENARGNRLHFLTMTTTKIAKDVENKIAKFLDPMVSHPGVPSLELELGTQFKKMLSNVLFQFN